MRLPTVGDGSLPWSPPATGSWSQGPGFLVGAVGVEEELLGVGGAILLSSPVQASRGSAGTST